MKKIKVKKQKEMVEYINEIRRSWSINPRTRVAESELKDKKKRRQDEKKIIKNDME